MKNEDYDMVLAKEEDEPYLYYKYNLDFYPRDEEVSLDYQIDIASNIKNLLNQKKLPSQIISEFEHLL